MPGKGSGGGGKKPAPAPTFNLIYGTDEPGTIDYIGPDSTILDRSTEGADKIWGYAGSDLIVAAGGDDVVYGGLDNDIIVGGTGNDTLWGDEGDDIIDGGEGNDTLYGGDGNDILVGSNGDDTVNGGAGDDQIIEGAGSDTVDGGDGIDTVYFVGSAGEYEEGTVVIGKGKNKVTATTYTYDGEDSSKDGEVDTFVNVENFVFIDTPYTGYDGLVQTATDFETVAYDGQVTLNVLDNDQIIGGVLGEGMHLTAILDVDLDGDGVSDLDIIPDGEGISYFTDDDGGILTDGSILKVTVDGTITWTPNPETVYPVGEENIYFSYEASDEIGDNTSIGDVFIFVTEPPAGAAQPGTVDFEGGTDLGYFYADGPNNSYQVAQLTNAVPLFPFEFREWDSVEGDFDFNDDGDNEFKIWTTDDGITHELNLHQADGLTFEVVSIRIEGLDDGEIVTLEYYSADGKTTIGTETVTTDSLDLDGEIYTVNQTDVGQFAVNISDGGTVYIDDIFIG